VIFLLPLKPGKMAGNFKGWNFRWRLMGRLTG
jgi:hypothetical protein